MAGVVKEKIKSFLQPDKSAPVTTPDASPGYVSGTANNTTTTNVPEAFYPGARPAFPQETHSTAPYSSAVGIPSSVPSDSAAMLGAPPSSGRGNKAASDDKGPEESAAAPTEETAKDSPMPPGADESLKDPTATTGDVDKTGQAPDLPAEEIPVDMEIKE